MHDHQIAQLVHEPGNLRRQLPEHPLNFGFRRIESFFEQKAAVEDRPTEVDDARALESVRELATVQTVEVDRRTACQRRFDRRGRQGLLCKGHGAPLSRLWRQAERLWDQATAAEAAWGGTRADAVRALTAHPFVRNLHVAEELYDDLAYANRDYLPERLLR